MNIQTVVDQIAVHISPVFASIYVVQKGTDKVLMEVPVAEMPPQIYDCYLQLDAEGLAILVADEYHIFLPILLTQTTLH